MGAVIMLGTLGGLIVLIFALVLRYDPQMSKPPARSSHAPEAPVKERIR